MRRREEVAARLSEAVLKRLVARKLIEVRDPERVRAAIQRIIGENLEMEEQIDAEAQRLLQGYARDIREQNLDYRQLLARTRERLARERGFVL